MPRKRMSDPSEYHSIFPTRLRKIMDERNETQQTVADAIKKTRQAVGYYCDGSSSPDWKTLIKLAEYLEVSTDWLLGLSDSKSSDPTIQQICAYTGLSDDTLSTFHGYVENQDRTKLSLFNALADFEILQNLLGDLEELALISRQRLDEEAEEQAEETLCDIQKHLCAIGKPNLRIVDTQTYLNYKEQSFYNTLQASFTLFLATQLQSSTKD